MKLIDWCCKHYFWLLACAVGVGATPAIWQYANASRGYAALGGEIFVPFLIPLIWFICDCLHTMWVEVKKEFEDDEEV